MADDKKQATSRSLFRQMKHALAQEGYEPDSSLLFSLIHSLPLNIYAKDLEGRFIFANSFYCKSVGKLREEIIGKTDYEIHPGGMAEKFLADDRRIMKTRQAESIEEPWQSIGGEHGYIQVIKTPLFDDIRREEVIGTLGIFWDITERKRTEIALAEEHNLLRTLIDNLPDFIYVKDTKSRFVIANKSVSRIMGCKDTDEPLGKTDFDFFSEADAEKFFDDEQQVIREEVPLYDEEESFEVPDGTVKWILTSKLPLRNLEGNVIGLVGMGHDITARKMAELERDRLQEQLLHIQKMETIGTLVAGIAHDFNNHLSVINGYAEILGLKTPQDDPNHKIFGKIVNAGRSAADLVNQLMAFSRKQVVQPQVVDTNKLLVNLLSMLRRVIGEKIEIGLKLAPDLWNVKIDPVQLEQVIVNFVANARDAMPEGGLLELETANVSFSDPQKRFLLDLQPGEYASLTIRDSGYGIEKDLQRKIFEPFFTTKEKHKGAGLGLATVMGIIQQNNGTVELESEIGKGATFRVYLPREFEAVSIQSEHEPEIDVSGGSETILVAEDEEDVRDLAAMVLNEKGYRVLCAANGKEALELAAASSEEISLLLTDVVMPGMSGPELADKLTSRLPALKVIFMSGYTDDAISQYDLSRPELAFIQKPFEPSVLTGKIRELLDD